MLVNRETCKRFADGRNNEKIFEIIGNKTGSRGQKLRITLPEGDICNKTKNNETRYRTIVEMECDPHEKYAKFQDPHEFHQDKCVNIIHMKSSHGKDFN